MFLLLALQRLLLAFLAHRLGILGFFIANPGRPQSIRHSFAGLDLEAVGLVLLVAVIVYLTDHLFSVMLVPESFLDVRTVGPVKEDDSLKFSFLDPWPRPQESAIRLISFANDATMCLI